LESRRDQAPRRNFTARNAGNPRPPLPGIVRIAPQYRDCEYAVTCYLALPFPDLHAKFFLSSVGCRTIKFG
jgi:hypothetical protein